MPRTRDHDKEALVAVAKEKVIGHAMYVRLADDGEAEMAIIVEDSWQSMGVGKSLLMELEERAGLHVPGDRVRDGGRRLPRAEAAAQGVGGTDSWPRRVRSVDHK